MIASSYLYISPQGGSIICFKGDSGRIFRSCSASRCVYTTDLHSAKVHLDNLEVRKRLNPHQNAVTALQRKTTLKWNSNGELSSVDMERVLHRLAHSELTECDLTCQLDKPYLDYQKNKSQEPLPATVWIP